MAEVAAYFHVAYKVRTPDRTSFSPEAKLPWRSENHRQHPAHR